MFTRAGESPLAHVRVILYSAVFSLLFFLEESWLFFSLSGAGELLLHRS